MRYLQQCARAALWFSAGVLALGCYETNVASVPLPATSDGDGLAGRGMEPRRDASTGMTAPMPEGLDAGKPMLRDAGRDPGAGRPADAAVSVPDCDDREQDVPPSCNDAGDLEPSVSCSVPAHECSGEQGVTNTLIGLHEATDTHQTI